MKVLIALVTFSVALACCAGAPGKPDPESTPSSHRAPLSMPVYLRRDSHTKVRTTANPWTTGDHTKTTIIDRKIAYVGGMNIGHEYRYEWHDLMMEVRGPVVNQLQYESDKAWARAWLLGDLANFLAFIKGEGKAADDEGYPLRVLQTKNFDKLSLKINKELNLATSNTSAVAELMDRVFIPDLMAAEEISEPVNITIIARVTEIIVDELL